MCEITSSGFYRLNLPRFAGCTFLGCEEASLAAGQVRPGSANKETGCTVHLINCSMFQDKHDLFHVSSRPPECPPNRLCSRGGTESQIFLRVFATQNGILKPAVIIEDGNILCNATEEVFTRLWEPPFEAPVIRSTGGTPKRCPFDNPEICKVANWWRSVQNMLLARYSEKA